MPRTTKPTQKQTPSPKPKATPPAIKPVQLNISELTSDPRNAKVHSARNIEVIKQSLTDFGQRKTIVVRKGVVLAGNGTLEAARQLGWTTIMADVGADELSERDARAYALVDNRSAELAEWDFDVLASEAKMLHNQDVDLELLGWEKNEVGEMLGIMPEQTEPAEAAPQKFAVIIEAKNERHQKSIIRKAQAEGWTCRALT